MMSISPFSALAESVSPSVIQGFVLAMLVLIVIGTVVQMIHHKNVTYFFNNAKKAKLAAERELRSWRKNINYFKNCSCMISQLLQSLELVKEELHTLWECMELFYFGLHLL